MIEKIAQFCDFFAPGGNVFVKENCRFLPLGGGPHFAIGDGNSGRERFQNIHSAGRVDSTVQVRRHLAISLAKNAQDDVALFELPKTNLNRVNVVGDEIGKANVDRDETQIAQLEIVVQRRNERIDEFLARVRK